MTGALQSLRGHALVLGTRASLSRRKNFGMWTHEPAQKLRVLIINERNLFRAE
jgi:hypothetical protein